MLSTPVLFLVFNRLDCTKQVFAQIRAIQPKQLFVGSDGARFHKEGEWAKVQAVRDYVVQNIDWPCDVKTLFRDKNLGCGLGPAEAITWFFGQVEQGIILEDDCLPDLSFFSFCENLLNYYKDNETIMHIGGNNYFNEEDHDSYYFSKYVHPPHGWASWRRAWKHYDYEMKELNIFLEGYKMKKIIKNPKLKKYWEDYFNFHVKTNLDAWDTQWQLELWLRNGLAIMPYLNLVSNIGYNFDATHTTDPEHKSNISVVFSINSVIHPKSILINDKYDDKKIEYLYMNKPTLIQKMYNLVPKFIKNILKKAIR